MLLDSTTQSLEILLAAAVATTQLPVVVDFTDGATTFSPTVQHSQTNGITAVTILTAPASTNKREVTFMSVYNAETVAVIITIRLNDNSVMRTIRKIVMEAGDNLCYTRDEGFEVTDKNGKKKVLSIDPSQIVMEGEQGEQGEMGIPGLPGLPGLMGLMGAPGIDGESGEDGDRGPPGQVGATGDAGATGQTGPQGGIGVPGLDGDDGEDGIQGPQGNTGPIGATGATGPTGQTGPQGGIGIPGLDGEDGEDSFVPGPPGVSGVAAHGSLTGLLNDDHTQYENHARAFARCAMGI